MSKFSERVVLITGASAGIGAALAQEFASEGANLVLFARRIEKLKEIAHSIDPTGARVLYLTCDVTKDGELEKAVELARAKFGKIDIAIANAGWSVKGKLEELSLADYRRQWETNVFGVLRTVYATLEDLKQTQGRLVIISSVKSYIALAGDSPYSMSKFALKALCQSLSRELTPYGISVTHVCPAYVGTEIRRIDNQGNFQPDWSDPISPRLIKSTEQTAKEIVKAVYRRQTEQVLTVYGKFIVLAQRHLPWLLSWLISRWQIKVVAKSN
ncbi:SDR family NAD(P)-dependent oxidoreductase [Merismopedia glauca]|uniref:Short-chain dehydrogenase n=1 Tax=Merismopedia glauca CCAP 1448/3 TaxID=1296344 RepID=A0A2T1C4G8_9CYAN|nr:SDR family NAD(P)-dependent oxidoreductase [Merismopedia glauca]PSB03013.1 short-chain dehydrogenase [Merismopedia glauca CCAP 1448/3]